MSRRIRYETTSHTNTSANQNGDLHIEDVLSRSTVRSIDSHDRKRTSDGGRIKLNEVSARSPESSRVFLVPFSAFHCGLSKGSHNGRPSTNALAKGLGPITDLTDVDRNVWVFWSRRDSKLCKPFEPLHRYG